MNISALTVCVQYSEFLKKSIERWQEGLESLLVVTDRDDDETMLLCEQSGAHCFVTNAFYRNGAAFNKGAAISEAVERCDWFHDWQLLFDADMVPSLGWRGVVETSGIQAGNLYGATRVLEDGTQNMPDLYELAGYFQLFHSSDEHAQTKPLLDCSWNHAGGMDSEFQSRWPNEKRHRLPLRLVHQGKPGRNWWGVNNQEAQDKMLAERRRLGRIAPSERMETKKENGL
jgi:hypothetical protein